MKILPHQRAAELAATPAQLPWLIQDLWTDQAVGILGGEPKCCKSFLALDVALAVASGVPCLRRYAVARTGPVLYFPAEDSLAIVRQRLDGLAAATGITLDRLPLHVITAPALRLDQSQDQQLLASTVETLAPVLLVLDPLIRLHQCDENDASQIAPLLSYLRQLQRRFHCAVLLVHHAKKDGNALRPGQALRGSSELHGWGDSNLYLRRQREQLTLTVEHRAAPSLAPIPVHLATVGSGLALAPMETTTAKSSSPAPDPEQRLLAILAQTNQAIALQALRLRCQMRTATVCALLQKLCAQGRVERRATGYLLKSGPEVASAAQPVRTTDNTLCQLPLLIGPDGNGNGKL
jgi:hypothetical protein